MHLSLQFFSLMTRMSLWDAYYCEEHQCSQLILTHHVTEMANHNTQLDKPGWLRRSIHVTSCQTKPYMTTHASTDIILTPSQPTVVIPYACLQSLQ